MGFSSSALKLFDRMIFYLMVAKIALKKFYFFVFLLTFWAHVTNTFLFQPLLSKSVVFLGDQ